MDTKQNNESQHNSARNMTTNRTEQHSSVPNDLPENKHDKDRLQPEETVINLPDVKDIPGQENVDVPPLGEMSDTTASSTDEEGDRIFEEQTNDDDDLDLSAGTNVQPKERRALDDDGYMPTRDEDNLRRATMDNTDFQGEELNEGSFGAKRSGYNMDIPDSENDTLNPFIRKDENKNKDYKGNTKPSE